MQAAAKTFMSVKHIAVAGASSIPSKFGHQIFAWYLDHGIPAIPMNPTLSSVTVQKKEYDTIASPSKLASPKDTSLSVITPPAVTAKILKEAKEVGVKAVWLQPGSFDDEILNYALEAFPGAAVGGYAEGSTAHEGWCVLVDGDDALAAAGRNDETKRQVDQGRASATGFADTVSTVPPSSKGRKVNAPPKKRLGSKQQIVKTNRHEPTRRSDRISNAGLKSEGSAQLPAKPP
ncbi:unnamed protein product [Zymoseptoria tritici ST99CH_1A5]|uniref:CoA-binding domain-containing protein n=1 Tax=Zymoseptoria tritici ST99CH_1A5 TaxID=1276529 RepID=A0A1Y6LJP0_ZYMTR|nr:unnamed protein product [Zymoseptoria tritici ST99CH_3D1]SMY24525.1 unnamed protein product [Zymoseptoria tritici ST99CH_1A5]